MQKDGKIIWQIFKNNTLSRNAKKGLKQVADFQCNALLHSYFALMSDSTTVRMMLQQLKYSVRNTQIVASH